MLTLYRPGTSVLHRAPAGPKSLVLLLVVCAVSLLPSTLWAAGAVTVVTGAAYLVAGFGLADLGRQVVALRWLILITMSGQLLFLGPEPAIANTFRVLATILLAALLSRTTRLSDLLDALERGLRPLARLGVDSERVALILTVAMATVPVLGRLAGGVREAQRARGAPANLAVFVVPFLVVALKHADELGDALSARGVQ
ncbi:energy-coupling factor transporter transmembrane protein EcfT [Mycetocola sp. 2940]|uniref:energy-coupling factor transporter transmembrane protein EcfT n=1 Tax=Mycetocola sp. 2940 TaxID=3156452 RepID=UPI0033907F49